MVSTGEEGCSHDKNSPREEGWFHAMNSQRSALGDLRDDDIASDSSKRSFKWSFINSDGCEECVYFDPVPSIETSCVETRELELVSICEETEEKKRVGEERDSIAICEEQDSVTKFESHNTPIVFEEHANAEECDTEASDSIIGSARGNQHNERNVTTVEYNGQLPAANNGPIVEEPIYATALKPRPIRYRKRPAKFEEFDTQFVRRIRLPVIHTVEANSKNDCRRSDMMVWNSCSKSNLYLIGAM